jgi:hypothetical protein
MFGGTGNASNSSIGTDNCLARGAGWICAADTVDCCGADDVRDSLVGGLLALNAALLALNAALFLSLPPACKFCNSKYFCLYFKYF